MIIAVVSLNFEFILFPFSVEVVMLFLTSDMVDSSNNISNLFTGITVCNNVTLMEMCGVDDIYCGECGMYHGFIYP